jgi:hypothetical protein
LPTFTDAFDLTPLFSAHSKKIFAKKGLSKPETIETPLRCN